MVGQGKSHALGCIFKRGCELLDGTNYENIKKECSQQRKRQNQRSQERDMFADFRKTV